MKNSILFLVVSVVVSSSCAQPFKAATPVVPRDKSVTTANAYTQLFLDSAAMEKFIVSASIRDSLANRLRSFYNSRNYEYGWFFKDGIADYASTFLGVQNDYISYSGDNTLYNPQLTQLVDSISSTNYKFNISDSNVLKTELMLSCQFFR